MSIFDCFQHIGDVGCTDIPEGIGSFWKGLKKLTEYVPEDIPTGDYSEPAESLEDAEDNETQCAQYDLTDGLSKVSSMPIEDIPRGDYGEPEIVPALVSFRHDQKPECKDNLHIPTSALGIRRLSSNNFLRPDSSPFYCFSKNDSSGSRLACLGNRRFYSKIKPPIFQIYP